MVLMLCLIENSMLKFTPLEFETQNYRVAKWARCLLKFTPLEFETSKP